MAQKKTIAYVGNFSFPYGNASGARVLGNGYVFKELGYEVIFIGLDNSLKSNSRLEDTKRVYNGFTYYNLPYPVGFKGWLSYAKRFNEAATCLKTYDLYAVISYGSPTLSVFNLKLKNWCSQKDSYYFTDCVDWLAAGSGSFLHRTIKFFDNDYQKRILNAKADGVIAISSYLSEFYSKKGCKTIVIPPLVDSDRYSILDISTSSNTSVELIYVGIPFPIDGRPVKADGYKDRLDLVIEELHVTSESNFIFNIYGLTKEQYLSVVEKHSVLLNELKNKIVFHGEISNSEAIIKIAKSDFTILFRDVNRMTSAGFPTKFVESISCGTPVITTKTSDLEQYLDVGKNGYFVDINGPNRQLAEILAKDKNDIRIMKNYCKDSKLFSYHNYTGKMEDFIKSI